MIPLFLPGVVDEIGIVKELLFVFCVNVLFRMLLLPIFSAFILVDNELLGLF